MALLPMPLNILMPLQVVLTAVVLALPAALLLLRDVVRHGVGGVVGPQVAVEVSGFSAASGTIRHGTLAPLGVVVDVFAGCFRGR